MCDRIGAILFSCSLDLKQNRKELANKFENSTVKMFQMQLKF